LARFTQGGKKLEDQERLGHTKRVEKLTNELGNQGAHSIYSGVAHAELIGTWRLFGWTVPGRGSEISATIDYVIGEMQRPHL
jgi:hypothetical protein